MSDDIVKRDANGKWLTPPRGGRKPGPSRAEVIAEYLQPHQKAILDKAIELALLGDPRSMELVLQRLAPTPRQDAERTVVPGFAAAGSMRAKAEAVLAAAAGGHISAEAAQKLLSCLDLYTKAVAQTEVEERLSALEQGKVLVQPDDETVIDVETLRPEDLA